MKRIIIIILIITQLSCSKSEEDKDREPPTIHLFTPQNMEGFSGSQVMYISGQVEDNRYIKEIHIEITNNTTAQEYLHVHIHPAAATATFNQAFTVQAGIVYSIRVIADDASSNSSVKKVQIACN